MRMSELKKKPRKSKLEVRDCVDADETIKSDLQVEPEKSASAILRKLFKPSKSDIIDHDYAMPMTPPVQLSGLQISVEVEEFDESVMSNVGPEHPSYPRNPKKTRQFKSFRIDIENIYKVADHIAMLTSNYADKFLSIEVKNMWGRALLEKHELDKYDEKIQNALNEWSQKTQTSSPLFYQCHICRLAWWYLTPFAEHVRKHKIEELKIYYIDGVDSFIVASRIYMFTPVYIPCGGECFRCGSPFSFHVRQDGEYFGCSGCSQTFKTCDKAVRHKTECTDKAEFHDQKVLKFKCKVCSRLFLSEASVDYHLVLAHQVRSDFVVPVTIKKCFRCQKTYSQYVLHKCAIRLCSVSCRFCIRTFSSKSAKEMHMKLSESNYRCKVCHMTLEKRCMATQHMLTHTNMFRVVYKCVNRRCPPTRLFCDEYSAKIHLLRFHKKKYDRRRNSFEEVLVPELCVTEIETYPMETLGASKDTTEVTDANNPAESDGNYQKQSDGNYQKQSDGNNQKQSDGNNQKQSDGNYQKQSDGNNQEFETEVDRCVSDYQTDRQTTKQENIVIKQELSDSDTEAMDYAEMLSKVFKVSNSDRKKPRSHTKPQELLKRHKTPQNVRTLEPKTYQIKNSLKQQPTKPQNNISPAPQNIVPVVPQIVQTLQPQNVQPIQLQIVQTLQPQNVQPIQLQIVQSLQPQINTTHNTESQKSLNIQITSVKSEPIDIDYDNFIDIQEDPITIKQEPVEACFGTFYQEKFQDDSFHTDNSEENECQIDIRQLDSGQNSSSDTGTMFGDMQIKSEMLSDDDNEMLVIDSDSDSDTSKLLAVKMEPEEVRKELLECSEVNDIKDLPDTYDEKAIFKTPHDERVHAKIIKEKQIKERKVTEAVKPKNKKGKQLTYDQYGNKIEKLYTCAQCGFVGSHKLYKIHKKSECELPTKSKVSVNVTCTKCNKTFTHMNKYIVHFEKHGYDVLHCPCCNVEMETVKELLTHFFRHVRVNYVNCWMIDEKMEAPTKKRHRCQICRETVVRKEFFKHYEAHMQLKSQTAPSEVQVKEERVAPQGDNTELLSNILTSALAQLRSPYMQKTCSVCSREFDRRNDLKRHVTEHLYMDALSKKNALCHSMLRCQICSEEFQRAEQYKFHMRTEHGYMPVYRCDLCDKTFSDSSNFAKHKKIHNIRVMVCDTCGKKFSSKLTLEKHVILHMTTDPIKCNVCNKKFYSMSQFKKHLKSSHNPKKFPCRCLTCNMTFGSFKKKWDHQWLVHKERKHEADCPICGQGFRKYSDVRAHCREMHDYYYRKEGIKEGKNENYS